MREPSAQAVAIKQRRLHMRLSREQLAKKAGISTSTVKNMEVGRHHPTPSTLVALAAAMEWPELLDTPPPVAQLMHETSPAALAELLGRYSVQALARALRLAKLDRWALFAELFPVSAAAAQTMARLDVGALAAEQRGDHA
jgi:transcriptional regulator with XRE-family HTH domain